MTSQAEQMREQAADGVAAKIFDFSPLRFRLSEDEQSELHGFVQELVLAALPLPPSPDVTGEPVAWRWRWKDDPEWITSEQHPADRATQTRLNRIGEVIPLYLYPPTPPAGEVAGLTERLRVDELFLAKSERSALVVIAHDIRQAADTITALSARVEELEKRLEIDHYWRISSNDDNDLEPIDIPPGDRDSFPDGISARDATIALLDEALKAAEARVAVLTEAHADLRKFLRDKEDTYNSLASTSSQDISRGYAPVPYHEANARVHKAKALAFATARAALTTEAERG